MTEQRTVPYSEDAEKGALGAMILDARTMIGVARAKLRIGPEHFYVPAHRLVCEAIYAIADKNPEHVDSLTVADWLQGKGELEKVGGSAGVDNIVAGCPSKTHGEYYLGIIRNKWILRRVVETARQIFVEGYEAETGEELLAGIPDRFLDIGKDVLQEISNTALMEASVARWRQAAADRIAGKTSNAAGLPMPWKSMTELTCGLEPGMFILGGRPSAGKTTLEDMLSCHVAGLGHAVGRVTLDASAKELLERALCRRSECSLPRLKFGFGFERHFSAMDAERERIGKLKMCFLENCYEVTQIMSWARMMKARHDIRLLTLDYIQQVHAKELGYRDTDPVVRVTHVSGMMKRLGLELGIPVLVLAQLNRDVEKEDREPRLSDLRDSGAIEQDAHKVAFLYRDMKKLKQMEEEHRGASKHKRPVVFSLLKQKDGECGEIPLWLYPPYFRFEPAQFTAEGDSFADDELPADAGRVQGELEEHPETMPREEGESHPKPAEKREAWQEELETLGGENYEP